MSKLHEPCVVCASSTFHRLGCSALSRLTFEVGVVASVVALSLVVWWGVTNASVKPAYPAAVAVAAFVCSGLSRGRASHFEDERRRLRAAGPSARQPKRGRLWKSIAAHLVVAGVLVLTANWLVVSEYAGGDGSYSCNSALDDFMGPRPPTSNFHLFDAGPPCWDEAKSRVLIAAVVIPLTVAAWVARCIALSRGRYRGPFVAAFVLFAVIGLYSGYVGGAG